MSAFMCTKTHIGTLAAYYARSGYDPMKMEDIYQDTFKIFDHENALSLLARYTDPVDDNMHHGAPSYFRMSEHAARLSPVEIIKAAQCYEYQACEHMGWYSSTAKKRIQAIIDEAVRHLPGYDDAKWGLDDIDLSGPDPISLMSLVK